MSPDRLGGRLDGDLDAVPAARPLAEGSTVVADLAPAAGGLIHGMLKDSLGVVWVLDGVAEDTPA